MRTISPHSDTVHFHQVGLINCKNFAGINFISWMKFFYQSTKKDPKVAKLNPAVKQYGYKILVVRIPS